VRSRGAYVHTAVNRDVGYLCVRERCDPSCKGRIPHAYVRAPRMGVTLTTDIHSVYQNPESVGAESEQRTEEAALAFHSRFLKIGHIFQPKYETCLRLLWLHWSWVPSAEKDVGAKGGGARRAEEEGGGGDRKNADLILLHVCTIRTGMKTEVVNQTAGNMIGNWKFGRMEGWRGSANFCPADNLRASKQRLLG